MVTRQEGISKTDYNKALVDSGAQENFVDDAWARRRGFIPTEGPAQNFLSINGDFFSATRFYHIECTVTDSRGVCKTTVQKFWSCSNMGHSMVLGYPWLLETDAAYFNWKKATWAYASMGLDGIEMLSAEEFEEILKEEPRLGASVIYVSRKECDCPKNWKKCACTGDDFDFTIDPGLDSSQDAMAVLRRVDESAKGPEQYLPEYLNEFSDVFDAEKAGRLPEQKGFEHAIETDGNVPYGPLYNLSGPQLEALRTYLQESLRKGWIRPSKSPAGAPILFVPKKDGGLRLCVDYRGLNKITIKNRHPLPLIDETLDRLTGASVFTKLDLRDAYYRIRIKEEDVWKTAFRTRYGHFEYLVMPMGLANAPATFQAYINKTLAGLLDDFVVVYLDDILIYSRNPEDHAEHVKRVLERLRKYDLYAKLSKCEFSVEEVEFLGFIVGKDGVRADPSRIETIQQWPVPTSFREVQVFLGFANFYRRFVHRYSHITSGLTSLLVGMEGGRKTGPFEMTPQAIESFRTLQKAFTTTPVLSHFDPEKPIRVETDASTFAIAAVLSQQQSSLDGTKQHWHPVAFWSRKLIPAERNYTTHDQELLAIHECFKAWRHYLEGAQHTIEVLTDHNNLRWFMTAKELSPRQTRWAMHLAAYDFNIHYRKGVLNPADGPSRRPDYGPVNSEPEDLTWLPTLQNKLKGVLACRILSGQLVSGADPNDIVGRLHSHAAAVLSSPALEERFGTPLAREKIRRTRDADISDHLPWIGTVEGCNHLIPRTWCARALATATAYIPKTAPFMVLLKEAQSRDETCRHHSTQAKRSQKGTPIWTLSEDGVLLHRSRIVVPNDQAMRQEVLRLHHDDPLAGHFGVNKTADLIRRTYFWEHMDDDVRDYIKECDVCQRNKSKKHAPYGLLQSLPQPTKPWQEISMDFITGLPPCKNPRGKAFDAILVVVDRFSKMARYIPCHKTMDSPELAERLFEKVFSVFGSPDGIVSDRGTVFTSNFWSAFCSYLHISRKLSTAFHPQTDGQTERLNQVLEGYLRSYCGKFKNDWGQKLPFAEFSYNNAKHTVNDLSPFHVCYGYDPKLPFNPGVQGPREVPAARQRIEQMKRMRDDLTELWNQAQKQRERYYNKKHRPKQYKVNQWVMLSTKNLRLKDGKLGPKYIGPFKVISCRGEVAYQLDLPPIYSRLHDTFHVSLLEEYHFKNGQSPDAIKGAYPDLADDDEDQEWEIEGIVEHRSRAKGTEFLVKWKGWSEDHNQWLPAYPHLRNSQEFMEEYTTAHGIPMPEDPETAPKRRRRGRQAKSK